MTANPSVFSLVVYKTARTFTAPSKSFLKCSPEEDYLKMVVVGQDSTRLKLVRTVFSDRGESWTKRAQEGHDPGEQREVGD